MNAGQERTRGLPLSDRRPYTLFILRLLVGLALVMVACGGSMSGEDSTVPVSTAATSTSTAATDAPVTGRVAAPDFSLELGDGATFVLSAASVPTYLIFWAEW